MSETILGIDFGTTNSLCAWMDGDLPTVIPNVRGARFTPSAIAATRKGEILVGESAKNQALVNPNNTLLHVKRRLSSGGLLSLGDKNWRPEELASFVLASLKADAEVHLGKALTKAVITAPANFSDRERRSLVEAGRLAGLEIVKVLNEPTAAALARAWARASISGAETLSEADSDRVILVYDFGGGTFDASLLRQRGSDCVVLASRGDGMLGGADLDKELYRRAAASFREDYGFDPDGDPYTVQQLSDQVERAKIELSERLEATVVLPFTIAISEVRASEKKAPGGTNSVLGGRVVHLERRFEREEFERIAAPYIERSLDLVERVLRDSGINASQVDALVLSGGSSRIPLVKRRIYERFGLVPEAGIGPEEIVALGAAVAAGLAEDETERGGVSRAERLRVRDVVARTYGVEIDGRLFVPIIKKNTPVPAERARVFTTVADRQESVEIHVLQGESREADDNLSLGRFLLAGVRQAKAGEPRISVDFSIDESGILHVGARDLDTGSSQAISITDIDRGEDDDSVAEVLGKARILADRIKDLRAGLTLEGWLEAELDEAAERVMRSSESSALGSAGAASEGEIRLLRAELEGLVGELLARTQEMRTP